jgi:hypothetical protein
MLMQLPGLAAMTTLSLDLVARCVGDRDIVSAIPVETDRPARESILVATRGRIGVVSRRRGAPGMLAVRWSTWESVRLGAHVGASDTTDAAAPFGLVVHIGERSYLALLKGPAGRDALRDFVVAAQAGQRA